MDGSSCQGLGPSCLVIDDDKYIRCVLSTYLKGFVTPCLAATGREGLDILEQRRPKVVIIDFHLPDMDFPELVQKVKSMHPALYLMAISSDATDTTVRTIANLGLRDFLTKPFTRTQVVRRLLACPELKWSDDEMLAMMGPQSQALA